MAYCAPLGIPHSRFLDWEERDQDKALAWLAFERTKCPGCSTFPEDYLDEDKKMISPPPWKVSDQICYGCLLIKDKTDEIGDKNLVGHNLYMVPNPDHKEPDELQGSN